MDYLQHLGQLALGSRLRRLSDRFGQEVASIYEEQGLDFQPRWFAVFRYLGSVDSASITDIAASAGITHPAVNQIEKELSAAGLVLTKTDRDDQRRRLLALSKKGRALHAKMEKTWSRLHAALSDVEEESGVNLVSAIESVERALEREGLTSRFTRLTEDALNCAPQVMHYAPHLASHFVRLNKAWIEQYFGLEQADYKVFADPGDIVSRGGEIVFVQIGNKVVGTCALVKLDNDTFELAKMAVDEAYRGKGYGELLLKTCIELAREKGASAVTLETNSKLSAAVRSYRRLGFEVVSGGVSSQYSRVDLVMRLSLNTSCAAL